MTSRDATSFFTASSNHVKAVQDLLSANLTSVINANVVLTGDGPFEAENVAKLLPGYPYVGKFVNEAPQVGVVVGLLVVGEQGWDSVVIDKALRSNATGLKVLPQEGFIDLILFGNDWWDDYKEWLDAAATHHSGLQYVKSLSWFPWPVTAAPESRGDGLLDAEFGTETPLHKMGYWVGSSPRELSANERWTVLVRAVKVLGLAEVVNTIANHVRLRKTQVDGVQKYRRAINKWEFDLQRLRRNYYEGRPPGFQWPSTEP